MVKETQVGLGLDGILVQGAREHNLKNLSLTIPRDRFVVITGVSGSGKSTLAFDIIFAEGQRRFLDSMNAYARQFVEQMAKPDVDLVAGIPPTVSIEQRNTRGGGKSTVATVTEVHQFFRLLFARLGTQHCPECGDAVLPQTRDRLVDGIADHSRKRGPLTLLAPVVRNRKGFHSEVARMALKHGLTHIRADGEIHKATDKFRLDRFKEHDVELVIGEIRMPGGRGRGRSGTVPDAVRKPIELALKLGKGSVYALDSSGEVTVHSTERTCPTCARSFEILDPKMFSYNSSRGWCPECRGFGEVFDIPDRDRGARADAIEESWFQWLSDEREKCPSCDGARLRKESLAVLLEVESMSAKPVGRPVRELPVLDMETLGEMTVSECSAYFSKLDFGGWQGDVARDILVEIRDRLHFLSRVGLEYLQLGRSVTTLSGGEGQRIRLASQLGSTLSGVLYVLDEPTIGLHARDNHQLLDALGELRRRGNSLIVVEHDEDTMACADHIIDLGPGAGVNGGTITGQGTLEELKKQPDSLTGRCLAEQREFPSRGSRRAVDMAQSETFIHLENAALHNLRGVDIRVPRDRFTVVTGVSGSGKSTLIKECFKPAMEAALTGGKAPELCGRIHGIEGFKAVYEVDQSPIGRTPRSTPATYVGLFDEIRKVFAQLPESRVRGFQAGKFSFNSAAGRCPECQGAGVIKIEMNFLPTAYVQCHQCLGGRYSEDVLSVEYQGLNIAQVLGLSVAEAREFFSAYRKICEPLEALAATGLDYLKLGQTSPTLSGGEAQRLKLVTHLLSGMVNTRGRAALRNIAGPAKKLFILEEPTIGLHTEDVRKLVKVIQDLVDNGNTVIVIEHHLELIAEADWVIDLGPEGGDRGGRIIASGTPEEIAAVKGSHTGFFLKKLPGLAKSGRAKRKKSPAAKTRTKSSA